MKLGKLYLPKKTGTYADALAAVGLGRLGFLLSGEHPSIEDEGWCYTIGWPGDGLIEVERLDFDEVRHDPGYPYMKLDPNETGVPSDSIDYRHERERLLNHRKLRDQMREMWKGRIPAEEAGQLKMAEPIPNWLLYQNLRVLQAYNSYNGLHLAIRQADPVGFADAALLKLQALMDQRDPASVVTPSFQPKITAVQAFNPTVGKGTNRPKPDGAALAGLPGIYVDWFEEWLRYIGASIAARSASVGDDIKVMAIVPQRVDESTLQTLHDDFVNIPQMWSSAKSDIITALGLARSLVKHSGLLATGDSRLAKYFLGRGARPNEVIAGIQVAYFASLGSARALTNVSFVGLPGWFRVTQENAADWQEILEEHEDVVKGLDEDRSEEAGLLVAYRDFLSAGDRGSEPLLRFLGKYAIHVMRRRARGQYVRVFTAGKLRRLVGAMQWTCEEIMGNPGFQAVAAAIRRATVTEQYHKSKKQQQYEVHYGLFADIVRQAEFREQLVATLARFAAQYDAENARYAERKEGQPPTADRRYRPRLTTEQLNEFFRLLDHNPPQVVAMLLLAFASARELREPAPDDQGTAVSAEGDDVTTAVTAQ